MHNITWSKLLEYTVNIHFHLVFVDLGEIKGEPEIRDHNIYTVGLKIKY